MNVYISHPLEPYSGGCILIAADTQYQAQQIVNSVIDTRYTEMSSPELVPYLSYSSLVPKVIVEHIYVE